MAGYKVLITTSGLGSRLGNLTRYTNKSMVRVGKKPAISYIIEYYPKDADFVVTVGHYKKHVKEFLNMAYPDRKFTFVEVDNFEKKGSSLGYSMLKAENDLQCPFYFHACDSIIFDKLPSPVDVNSYSGMKNCSGERYRTYNTSEGYVSEIKNKGEINFEYSCVGVCGIKDYDSFWRNMNKLYNNDPTDESLCDCHAINGMLKEGIKFKSIELNQWFDIGNSEDLLKSRNNISDKFEILDKDTESIFLFDEFVIKFFHNPNIVKNRVIRNENLNGLVPKIIDHGNNFYKYQFVKGDLYSNVVNEINFIDFLKWCDFNLWAAAVFENFKDVCYNFYVNKTDERINEYHKIKSISDKEDIINGVTVPKISELLSQVDFDSICNTCPTQFHGDLILDNIIKTPTGFSLLDWRQDFGNITEAGDMYYDLSKLNHSLVLSHNLINKGLFHINKTNNGIECNILRSDILTRCQELLHKFIIENDYDLKRVKILTAIIWLNMSPLHQYPLNDFLYYFGKLNLYRSLNE